MLSDKLKKTIQTAYSRFLEQKQLKARYGQKLMIAQVARSLAQTAQDGEDAPPAMAAVEAGTGTGKTVAYLLGALPVAQAHDKTLVVSTATVALQEQIVMKDLPDLRKHSGLQFDFSLVKGRGRYLCVSKLDALLQVADGSDGGNLNLFWEQGPDQSPQTQRLYRELLSALAGNRWDGDRDSWPQAIEDNVWQSLSTDHHQCTGRHCDHIAQCPFFKARESLNKVDCIVANHDLVLADLALGGGAILPSPEDTIYVFDEGHHLPDKAIQHFAYNCRLRSTQKWLEQVRRTGVDIGKELVNVPGLTRQLQPLPEILDEVSLFVGQLIPVLEPLLAGLEGDAEKERRYRFSNGVVPEPLLLPAREIKRCFAKLHNTLDGMLGTLQEAMEEGCPGLSKAQLEPWLALLGSWVSRADHSTQLWIHFILADGEDKPPLARWLVIPANSTDVEVCCSPILASEQLAYSLWSRAGGAVVTSATLTALGRFERFRMRSGMPKAASYEVVPSPFDYASAGVLQVPRLESEPTNAEAHTNELIERLPEWLDANEGSLVLFASRRQMLAVYEGLPGAWRERTLCQGSLAKHELLRQHRQAVDDGRGSVLFGLASFAEGVDLPGAYCQHVVIAKIPFAVPDQPVDAALSEWIEAQGGNAFLQVTVPDASVRLVQACGRLLRTESDRGRVTLLDRRVLTKSYGTALLNALPPFQRHLG